MWNSGGPGSGGGPGAHVPAATASGGDGYSFGGFGGMIGRAKLLVRQRAWFEDSVHVTCADARGTGGRWHCAVQFSLLGKLDEADQVTVTVCEAWGASTCLPAVETVANSTRMTVTVPIPDAQLWVPGTPAGQANLYTANLSIAGRALNTTSSARFGVRSLSTDGPRILFNGEPLFLRGYGDDGQYAVTGAPPMEKSYYLKQLSDMKSLGFNFIRFHTHSMPDVFHEAADELGFLCDPEFAMNYAYPCPFPGCAPNDLVHEVFNRSFTSIVQRTSHHPSLFGYVLSNEIGFGKSSQFVELYRFANQHDPERPCWFGDGSTGVSGYNLTALSCRNGQDATDEHCFMDVWVPQSGWSHTAVKDDISSGVDAAALPVPMLLHEAMDARTFPRLESNLLSFEGGTLKVTISCCAIRLSELQLSGLSDSLPAGWDVVQRFDRAHASTWSVGGA